MQKLSSLPGVYFWGTGRAEKKGDTGRSRKSHQQRNLRKSMRASKKKVFQRGSSGQQLRGQFSKDIAETLDLAKWGFFSGLDRSGFRAWW